MNAAKPANTIAHSVVITALGYISASYMGYWNALQVRRRRCGQYLETVAEDKQHVWSSFQH